VPFLAAAGSPIDTAHGANLAHQTMFILSNIKKKMSS
jgi:hypothetical protein